MSKPQRRHSSHCPIAYMLDLIGDRWVLLIIRDIIFRQKSYFGDFANSKESIATNVLSDRLKRLEEQGIISKKQDEDNLSKYIYSLTDMGLDLLPIMVEMILFAGKYDKQTAASKDFLANLKRNKQKFINEYRKKADA